MLMNIPMHCLEGLLVSRVDEQQVHWLSEWISNMFLLFGISCSKTHGGQCLRESSMSVICLVVFVST